MKKTVSFEKDLNFPTMIGEVSSISLDDDLVFTDSSNVSGKFIVSGKYKMTEASRLEEEFSFDIPIEIALMEKYDLTTTNIQIIDFTYEIVDDDTLRCNVAVLLEGVEEVEVENDDIEDVVEASISEVEAAKENILDDIQQERSFDISGDDEYSKNTNNCEERECDGEMKEEKEIPMKNIEEIVPIESSKEEFTTENTTTNNITTNSTLLSSQLSIPNSNNTENTNNITNKMGSLFSNLADDDDTFKTYSIYIMREGDNLENIMERYKVSKEDLENYNDLSSIQINSKVIIPTDINEE